MSQLESSKRINKLKLSAIKNGGYIKNREAIIEACTYHLTTYEQDLFPKNLAEFRDTEYEEDMKWYRDQMSLGSNS
jgi:hypothetical protein